MKNSKKNINYRKNELFSFNLSKCVVQFLRKLGIIINTNGKKDRDI